MGDALFFQKYLPSLNTSILVHSNWTQVRNETFNLNIPKSLTLFFSKYFCLKTLNFGTFILNASEKQNVQFECTKNCVTLVPRLVGTRRKTTAIHKKNGTQSRENAGHIDIVLKFILVIVDPIGHNRTSNSYNGGEHSLCPPQFPPFFPNNRCRKGLF